jgi:DNA-directed RNA polymerase subunit RPC12/RpoP
MGRRHVKEFRPDEALNLITADREGKDLRCPSCGSEAIERSPRRPRNGGRTPGRVRLTCTECSRLVAYIDRAVGTPVGMR